jgi:thymidine kinase
MHHRLTIHTGPMKSAKSLDLVREYDLRRTAKQKVIAFRPRADERNQQPTITTRFNNNSVEGIPAVIVQESSGILQHIPRDCSCVLIDEAEMFDAGLPLVVTKLLADYDVVISGLDLDFRGWPFGPMAELLALADDVHKHVAICDVCRSRDARYSQRLVDGEPAPATAPTLVPETTGQAVIYQARCKPCFIAPPDLEEWLQSQNSPK